MSVRPHPRLLRRLDLGLTYPWLGVGLGLALVALLVPLLSLWRTVAASSELLVFLVPVVLATVIGGQRAGVLVACAAVVVCDWYFTPPLYQLYPFDKGQDGVALLVFVAVALLVGRLTGGARQREQLLRVVLRQAPLILLRLDRQGRITLLEGHGLAALGGDPAALVGRSLFAVAPDQPEIAAQARRALTGEELTTTLERRGVVLETRWTPLRDAAQGVLGAICVATEVTARTRAEEARADAERFARATLDALAAEIAILDQDGTILAVNAAWDAFAQANAPSVSGLGAGANYLRVCETARGPGSEGAQDVAAGIRAVLAGQRPAFALEYPCHAPDTPRWFVGRMTRFGGRGPARVVVAHEEITARRQAEEALRQANADLQQATQAKSRFLATMSHEMRTPLNGVIGLVSLLGDTALSPQQRDYLSALHTSADALLSLISDILDFSKIEAGQLTLEQQPLDLHQLVREVVALFAAQAQTKGLRLLAQVDPAVPALLVGDRLRLRQVLLNLVGNALKFTAHGLVEVTVRQEDDSPAGVRVRLAVRDTGIGIAPQVQEALFAPFAQADASTTRRYGGTGLGLAIAKQLVELMGGQIGVQSAPGQGSTFWLELRLARGAAAADTPVAETTSDAAGPPAAASAPRRGRILVAEDNAINRLVTVGLLESLGYTVATVETGQQAVAAVQAEAYDVVLMDVHMPEMDGLTATMAIRQQERAAGPGRQLPIVALTADALAGDAERSLAAGMDDHLSKPLTRERLAAVLARWAPADAQGA